MKISPIENNILMLPKRVAAPFKRKTRRYQIPHRTLASKVRVLEVGQSFLVEASDPRELQRRMAGAIGGSYIVNNPIYGRRYSIRQVDNGVRVWRKL